MSTSESRSGVVLELAEEFLERYRQGQRPSLKEYIDRHPELAAEIKDVFPAMALMENIALADESLVGDEPASGGRQPPDTLKQLGDFRIIREVGHGGMGIVYEAEQVSLGRHVALKVLPQKLLLDAGRKRRFEREAKAAAKLHHTNIVPVFGVGEQDGIPYYVMQFIQGRGLDEVIEELRHLRHPGQPTTQPEGPRQVSDSSQQDFSAADVARSLLTGEFQPPIGPTVEDSPREADPAAAPPPASSSGGRLSDTFSPSSSSVVLPGQSEESHKARGKKPTYWQSVAQLGVQVAEALEHAHGQGILHRDIKPSNLLLDLRGSVWVTDFGLAKADDQPNLTATGDILGTLRYMPPEAFEGQADARSDLYALGLTLYELLAFRPAFDQKDRPRLVQQVTAAEPPRLGKLNPQVPRDLETVVHKAIDREPGRRYPSAAALAADLRRFLEDEPIEARRQSEAERLLRWARRHKGVAAALSAVALLLVLLAAGAVLAAASFRQQEQEQRRLAGEKEEERGRAEQARTLAEEAQKKESDLRALAEKQGQELRRNLYVAEMNLAEQAAESPSGIGRVGELLAPWPRSQPDLRGWEWFYFKGLCHRDLLTLRGHTFGVASVAWSPDGTRLASAGGDGTVKVWEAASSKGTLTLRGHTNTVKSVAWSPDGTRLASTSWDATVKVWEAASGKDTLTLRGHTNPVESVAWSPDGTRLASAGADGTVKVWDTAAAKETLTLREHSQRVLSVAWSPDGTRLASASDDQTILVHDATLGYVLERSSQLLPMLDQRLAVDPKNVKDWQLRAEIDARRGDWDRAAADVRHYLALSQEHPRWYATDWRVVGPYPENLKESCPPERDPDPNQPVAAAAAQAGTTPARLPWQVIPRDAYGFVDFGVLFDRAEHISGYALTRIYSPEKQEVAILLGSDGGVRLWLNGGLVHENPLRRTAAPDQDAVPATQEAGWNTLLARVANGTGRHALYLRLSAEPADLARASASALVEWGRWDEAERVVAEALAKQPDHAPTRALAERFYRQRADTDARNGDWARVAADYAQVLKLRPEDHTLWYWAGTALAQLGDAPAYQQHRRAMLERFGATEDPMIAERTAKVCLLLPADADELKRLGALAERAVTNGAARGELPYFHLARGLAEYRRGNRDAAEEWLGKALSAKNASWNLTVPAHLILAMIQQRRGKSQEARESLARAVALFDREAPQPGSPNYSQDWHDRLICQVLRREAEALLGGTEPEPKK